MKFIFLGIIQGLTEFLPISSSGHLYIFKKYLDITQDTLPFFVFLHFATLLVICVFLRRQIILLLRRRRILVHLAIITLITLIFGLVIDCFFKSFFENKYWISFLLLINGGVLLSAKNTSQSRDHSSITIGDSVILGILQGLAVFPGISRSGITITALLKKGFKTEEAFNLSFLMVIPVILGASLFKFKKLFGAGIATSSIFGGFISAFLFGLLALIVLKKIVIKGKFNRFGYYCIAISLFTLIFCR